MSLQEDLQPWWKTLAVLLIVAVEEVIWFLVLCCKDERRNAFLVARGISP